MSRLQDPEGLVSEQELARLSKKIDQGMLRLALGTKQGGKPFFYSWMASQPHVLVTKVGKTEVSTAATDGKQYFWNPEALAKISSRDIVVIMEHEVNHVISHHTNKFKGKHPIAWAVAIDLVVNARIEEDWIRIKPSLPVQKKKNLPDSLFDSSAFGTKIGLQDVKDILSGDRENPEKIVLVDRSCFSKSPEEVYQELLPYFNNQQNSNNNSGGETQDSEAQSSEAPQDSQNEQGKQQLHSLDTHLEPVLDEDELLEKVMLSQERAEAIEPGSTPAYIQSMLDQLSEPTVDLSEYMRMYSLQASTDGRRNKWNRPRRRSQSLGIYLPSKTGFHSRWLCLLDTSFSMNNKDIAYGVSQLKSLIGESEGVIVPCDTEVHWKFASEIKDVDDLQKTKVVGRGGTVFHDFFHNYQEKLGDDFDLIIVITDAYVMLTGIDDPEIDCVWAVTSDNKNFSPPFGEVVLCRDPNF